MRRGIGAFCMLLGALMLALAAWMLIANDREERSAEQSAKTALESVRLAIESEDDAPDAPTDAAESEAEQTAETPEMAEVEIDGERYIGYIELPTLELYLPVMSEWNYDRLKVAPCRYVGNVHDDSMIILAHSYRRHFRRLGEMQIGDPVQFIDASGDVFSYRVTMMEVLEPYETDRLLTGEWDLTLFSCTRSGTARQIVRLTRVNAY